MTDLSKADKLNDAKPAPRVRLVSITVQVEAVADDGDHLHPIETQALRIPASAWGQWHPDLAIAELQARLMP